MINKNVNKYIKDAKDTLEITGDISVLTGEDKWRVLDLILRTAEMIQRENQTKKGVSKETNHDEEDVTE